MSTKSKLYELIQLSQNSKFPIRLSRPKFIDSDRFEKETNTHYMTCSATIEIDGKEESFTSDVFSNKKDANQDVCLKIFKRINGLDQESQSVKQKTIKSTSSYQKAKYYGEIAINKNLLILIDYENISAEKELEKLWRFLSRVYAPDIVRDNKDDEGNEGDGGCVESEFYGIEVIKFAGHSSSMKAKADVVVKSTRKDAVDHYIGFYLGKVLGESPSMAETHSIHVLSKDHFASCLEDFCPNVTHNVDVDHLIESIMELSEEV